jgi:hypothetical protein
MEILLHYIWKHRIMPLHELRTTDGRLVEVIDPGLHNHHDGPDFFNAKVKIGGVVWVGNVEIHERSADWYAHHHDKDEAYNNVVLHIASVIDADIVTAGGSRPPQLELHVPQSVADNYRRLLAADPYPPCREAVMQMSPFVVHSWLSALMAERADDKGAAMERRVALSDGSWEKAFFITLARSFGFGTNSDAFEQWATALPLMQVAHHRDHPMQVEAMFLGTAGLLDATAMPQRQREAALRDDYFLSLQREYAYLAHKFSLTAMPRTMWRFMRLRPQNSPYIRLSQLATLYCSRRADLSQVTSCTTLDEVSQALATEVSTYWRTHYTFGNESSENTKRLSAQSLRLLVVNAVVPALHAYGRHRHDEALVQRAAMLLEALPPEDNTYIRLWKECGVSAENAADTQALIQLHSRYCERKECLRCRFGYYMLKGKRAQQ